MDFFGIGFPELLLILVVALVVLGPGKIVDVGRSLGKFMYNLKKASSDITAQISREIELEKQEINNLKKASADINVKLSQQLQQEKQELKSHLPPVRFEGILTKSEQDKPLLPEVTATIPRDQDQV